MADTISNAVAIAKPLSEREEILKKNADRSFDEVVEVPKTDLFGDEHTGVAINFVHYGPGKHTVNYETAQEIKKLVNNKLVGDMRVLQPTKDVRMKEIMERGGKQAAW